MIHFLSRGRVTQDWCQLYGALSVHGTRCQLDFQFAAGSVVVHPVGCFRKACNGITSTNGRCNLHALSPGKIAVQLHGCCRQPYAGHRRLHNDVQRAPGNRPSIRQRSRIGKGVCSRLRRIVRVKEFCIDLFFLCVIRQNNFLRLRAGRRSHLGLGHKRHTGQRITGQRQAHIGLVRSCCEEAVQLQGGGSQLHGRHGVDHLNLQCHRRNPSAVFVTQNARAFEAVGSRIRHVVRIDLCVDFARFRVVVEPQFLRLLIGRLRLFVRGHNLHFRNADRQILLCQRDRCCVKNIREFVVELQRTLPQLRHRQCTDDIHRVVEGYAVVPAIGAAFANPDEDAVSDPPAVRVRRQCQGQMRPVILAGDPFCGTGDFRVGQIHRFTVFQNLNGRLRAITPHGIDGARRGAQTQLGTGVHRGKGDILVHRHGVALQVDCHLHFGVRFGSRQCLERVRVANRHHAVGIPGGNLEVRIARQLHIRDGLSRGSDTQIGPAVQIEEIELARLLHGDAGQRVGNLHLKIVGILAIIGCDLQLERVSIVGNGRQRADS